MIWCENYGAENPSRTITNGPFWGGEDEKEEGNKGEKVSHKIWSKCQKKTIGTVVEKGERKRRTF